MNAKTGYKIELLRGVESEWRSVWCVLTKSLLPDPAVHMLSIPHVWLPLPAAFLTFWLILNKEAEMLENTSSPCGFCSCSQDLGNAFLKGVQDEGWNLQADCSSLQGKCCVSTTWPVCLSEHVPTQAKSDHPARPLCDCRAGGSLCSWLLARCSDSPATSLRRGTCPSLNSPSGRFSGLLPSHF